MGLRLFYNGIDPTGNALAESETADLKKLTEFLEDDYNGNRIVIDSQEVANCYPKWLATNKKAGSDPGELYDQAKPSRRRSRARPSGSTQRRPRPVLACPSSPRSRTRPSPRRGQDGVGPLLRLRFVHFQPAAPGRAPLRGARRCLREGPVRARTPVTTSTTWTTRAPSSCSAAISGLSSS